MPHFQEIVGDYRVVYADSLFGLFVDTHRATNRRPALSTSKSFNSRPPPPPTPGFLLPAPHIGSISIMTPTPLPSPLPIVTVFHPSLLHCPYLMPSSCRNISLRVSIFHQHDSLYCFLKPILPMHSIRTEQKFLKLEPPLFVYCIGKYYLLRTM